MKRTNVTTWQDGETLTRLMGSLAEALMKYQKYALMDQDSGKFGVGALGGDQSVIVEAITLRNRLDALIERSKRANTL